MFAIAAVVDHFSDAIVENPIVGKSSKNPALREWHTQNLGRRPGLKFMRTLWVCNVAGVPLQYVGTRPGQTPSGSRRRAGIFGSHRMSFAARHQDCRARSDLVESAALPCPPSPRAGVSLVAEVS